MAEKAPERKLARKGSKLGGTSLFADRNKMIQDANAQYDQTTMSKNYKVFLGAKVFWPPDCSD